MSSMVEIDNENFELLVLRNDRLVVIDFYATWCPPCRALQPILERLSYDFAGKIKFVKINIDSQPRIAADFEIGSVPTLVFVRDGKELSRFAGLADESQLEQLLTSMVANDDASVAA